MSKLLAVAGIVSAGFIVYMYLAWLDPYLGITKEYRLSPVAQIQPGLFVNGSKVEILVHEAINEHREAKGLKPLVWDEELAIIARNHSADMANRGYFDHDDPEGHGHPYRYEVAEYSCQRSSGENLYMTTKTPIGESDEKIADLAVVGWMNSEGHRKNVLYDGYAREGIGVYVRTGDVHVTQNFC